MPAHRTRILILGGTAEAKLLASRLSELPVHAITSLAGRTSAPMPVDGVSRSGGFGGVDGLANYLRDQNIDLMIDATHPYASRISSNAQQAADIAALPLIRLERPVWQKISGDQWHDVADETAAAAQLPQDAIAFLALGRQHIAPFSARDDVYFIMRMIDPPETPLPVHHEVVLGKPCGLNDEITFLKNRRITHIVSRNSGGTASHAKIEAARSLSLPVLMIARPPVAARHVVETVAGALDFVRLNSKF